MFSESLAEGLNKLKIPYSEKQIDQCRHFFDFLMEWNQKMNLTSIKEENDAVQKHFLDSLAPLSQSLLPQSGSILDIGAGAGFPSIPLAIFLPHCSVTMVDSVRKKVSFLEAACHELSLNNTKAVWGRAEDLGRDPSLRERFDLIVNRALAPLNVLLEYGMPFLRVGGRMLCYKGPAAEEEILQAKRALHLTGAKVLEVHPSKLDGLEHFIIELLKESPINASYPRKAGLPTKSPL